MGIRIAIKHALCTLSNIHRPGDKQDIFVFATPRGGSTWLAEIIASQPSIKLIDEPLNFRRDNVASIGLFDDWFDLIYGGNIDDQIIHYLNDLRRGRYGIMNPVPFRRNHRFFTNRIVFKIHEAEHLMRRIQQECNGKIVFLLRHPIPTTLSRTVFPRISYFLKSGSFRERYLGMEEFEFSEQIVRSGDAFEIGILSWAIENLIPLRSIDSKDWLTVTYEELLLEPEKMAQMLATRMELDDHAAVLRSMFRESTNIGMSSEATQHILKDPDRSRRNRKLVTKWKASVLDSQRIRCSEILKRFGIDAYYGDKFLPSDRYCQFMNTDRMEQILSSES